MAGKVDCLKKELNVHVFEDATQHGSEFQTLTVLGKKNNLKLEQLLACHVTM